MTVNDQFRTRVRAIMRVRGLTDADLAARMDVKAQAVTKFLSPLWPCTRTARSLRRYAEALGVSVAYLEGRANIEAALCEIPAMKGEPPITVL